MKYKMISKVDFYYANWCKPCQRMIPQKKRLIKFCENRNIPIHLHCAPDDEYGKEQFRKILLSKELQKIPSVIFTFENNKVRRFHNLNETMWIGVFSFLDGINFNVEVDNDDF